MPVFVRVRHVAVFGRPLCPLYPAQLSPLNNEQRGVLFEAIIEEYQQYNTAIWDIGHLLFYWLLEAAIALLPPFGR